VTSPSCPCHVLVGKRRRAAAAVDRDRIAVKNAHKRGVREVQRRGRDGIVNFRHDTQAADRERRLLTVSVVLASLAGPKSGSAKFALKTVRQRVNRPATPSADVLSEAEKEPLA